MRTGHNHITKLNSNTQGVVVSVAIEYGRQGPWWTEMTDAPRPRRAADPADVDAPPSRTNSHALPVQQAAQG